MSLLFKERSFPEHYPDDVVKVLKAMSFTNGESLEILGSSSLRSQQYAGDYDGYEIVRVSPPLKSALERLANRFQEMIRALKAMRDVYIGDIKAGAIDEWRVLPKTAGVKKGKVVGYDPSAVRRKIHTLLDAKIISNDEALNALQYALPKPTPVQMLRLKGACKFHIARWTTAEVLRGFKLLPDGRRFTLADAFQSPGITKLDTIALVENHKYAEFSVIYQFVVSGKVLNKETINPTQSIQENILMYEAEGNPFKVLKRKLSLAKAKKQTATAQRLTEILNSDLGRLYLVLSDISTLIALLRSASPPLEKVRFEIDQFRGRLTKIYSAEAYLKSEKALLEDLRKVSQRQTRESIADGLEDIEARLLHSLEKATTARLKGSGSPSPIYHTQ